MRYSGLFRWSGPETRRQHSTGSRNILRPLVGGGHLVGMEQNLPGTQTWPDLAIGLYDKLTGRNAEISYEFDGLEIGVPSSASSHAQQATWRVSGTVKIRTKDAAATPARS